MHASLGLPVFNPEAMIGMVGVANRPGGYDAALVESVRALLATYASLIEARRPHIGVCCVHRERPSRGTHGNARASGWQSAVLSVGRSRCGSVAWLG
ncbi:MAG: hypothetical protein ACKOBM_16330 [Gammaproteobacteria bacterium]